MAPFAIALIAGGTLIKGLGQYRANLAQADAEEKNASFYREEAEFARKTGDRQRMIFDRESDLLFGKQQAAFAKGGSGKGDLKFLAQQRIFREQESNAIQDEADFNVRLATLRSEHSMDTAKQLRSGRNNQMQFAGGALQAGGSVL